MIAALLLAAAVWAAADPARTRVRASATSADRRRPGRSGRPPHRADPLAVASSLDVLAVCLTAGMTVAGAAAATAASAPEPLARVLRRAADLLALGADPATAWSAVSGSDPQTDALLRLARRSAASGSALAHGVADLAGRCRRDAEHAATAAAGRAATLIAGPLGLCFLPAFVCLGIIPVVIGLGSNIIRSGLL